MQCAECFAEVQAQRSTSQRVRSCNDDDLHAPDSLVERLAGFGDAWSQVPADLAQAVILLAARYYDDRSQDGLRHALPFGVSALIERWRAVRTLAGRGGRA